MQTGGNETKRCRVSVCAHRPAAISQDAPALTRRPSKKVTNVKAAKSTAPSLSAHNRANVSGSDQLRVVPEPGPIYRNVNFFDCSQAEKYRAEDQTCS